ncbi:MAG: tyrosine-type recombinase/integrase [Chloroflexi bacterium]|nr:tyrosine-type recombinase/integrase [Chloroflexota bacterium]
MKLQTLIDKYFLAHQGIYMDATMKWYRAYLSPLEQLSKKKIKKITIDDLRAIYAGLSQKDKLYENHPHQGCQVKRKGYSPYTLHCFARSWRRLFQWAVEEGHLGISPAKLLQLPDLSNPDPKALNRDDLLQLLSIAPTSQHPERDEAILRFLADTNVRIGGASILQLADLSLANGWARVREKGKGLRKSRTVYFKAFTSRSLAAWLVVRPSTLRDKRVFQLTASGMRQAIDRLAEKIELLGPHNPHSFRHGFALGMLERGANLAQASQTMGHKSAKVTIDYYGQFPVVQLQDFHAKYSWAPEKGEHYTPTSLKKDEADNPPPPAPAEEPTDDPSQTLIATPKAFEIAREHGYKLPPGTLHHAVSKGNIRNARRYGCDWVFPRGDFEDWLLNRYRPRGKQK